jgi:hypothetical protein
MTDGRTKRRLYAHPKGSIKSVISEPKRISSHSQTRTVRSDNFNKNIKNLLTVLFFIKTYIHLTRVLISKRADFNEFSNYKQRFFCS